MNKYFYSFVPLLLFLGGCFFFGSHQVLAVAQQTTLTNPIGGGTDIRVVVGLILKGVLGLTGTIALIIFIYGGFQWLFARGEPGEVKKGMDTMIWAGLGLVVIFGSYAVLQRVFAIIPQ